MDKYPDHERQGPSMSSSLAHMSGTSPNGNSRAAAAGNPQRKSGVAVKRIEIKSEGSIRLRWNSSCRSSTTASRISPASSLLSLVAPRSALTAIDEPYPIWSALPVGRYSFLSACRLSCRALLEQYSKYCYINSYDHKGAVDKYSNRFPRTASLCRYVDKCLF